VSTFTALIKQITRGEQSPAGMTLWLGADRTLRLGLNFVVQLLVVRHLGPAGNGILQNGLALAALGGVVVDLGLDGILKRELARAPQQAGPLLGTATALRSAALAPCVAVFLWAAARQPGATPALVAWLAVTLALPLALTPEAWLLATGRVTANVLAQGLAFAAAAALRIGLVLGGAAVAAFAAASALEAALIALALGAVFIGWGAGARAWSWDRALARTLLRDATPLLLTTLAITVYRRIDVVILSHLAGPAAAGLYTAAVRISEIGYLAPMIFFNAWFPHLTRLHAEDRRRYEAALGDFYRKVTWSAAAFALVVSLSAPWLVRVMFGEAFAGSVTPLVVHAWTAVFIAHGIGRSLWLVVENRQFTGLWLAVAGAAANIALNFLLVPRFGVNAAAVATLAALALNMAVFPVFSAQTRPIWALGWKATFAPRKRHQPDQP
jgi:polysaccharide transporter, PST family